jgi:hypothetical protein
MPATPLFGRPIIDRCLCVVSLRVNFIEVTRNHRLSGE